MIKITEQQKKVLTMFAQGKTMKEIALALDVSYSRVINILNELLIKTGFKSKRELLANAKIIEFEVN